MNRSSYLYKSLLITLVALTIAFTWKITHHPYMVIRAKFDTLPPLPRKLEVYYKGLDVGDVFNKEFDENGKNILIYIEIYKKNLNLPANSYVIIREGDPPQTKEIIVEFVYPEKPLKERLNDGMTIEGRAARDLDYYLGKYVSDETVDGLIGNASKTMEGITKTADEFGKIAETMGNIVKENRSDIRKIFANSAAATENLKNATKGLSDIANNPNISASLESFNSASQNIDAITAREKILASIDNIEATTKNIREATDGLKCTFAKADETIESANTAIQNADSLTKSLCKALNRRFAFLRFMFGRPGCGTDKKESTCPICSNAAQSE